MTSVPPRLESAVGVPFDGLGPDPPPWVDAWVGSGQSTSLREDALGVETYVGNGFARISVSFDDVEKMDLLTFQQAVADAYRVGFEHLDALRLYALRLWAFIPWIHADYAGLDRYRVFNAGRFAAYSARLGGRAAFSRSVPTASAVGSRETALHVHCLAAYRPGTPVENPRQVPAYRYSRRFGPLPPCFARATLVPRESGQTERLLVGGTASIVGEESMHEGDLPQQIDETFRNLAAVVGSACLGASSALSSTRSEADWLAAYRELRVYHREAAAFETIRARVRETFPGVGRIEIRQAELCRPELLVEIEGMADLPPH
jgi:chorismate lyase / 3-hydroxybenzoate synthase